MEIRENAPEVCSELIVLNQLIANCRQLNKQEAERCIKYLQQWNEKRPAGTE